MMVVLFQIAELIISIALTLFLFSKVNGGKLTHTEVLLAVFIRFAIAATLVILGSIVDVELINYISYPLYMVVL